MAWDCFPAARAVEEETKQKREEESKYLYSNQKTSIVKDGEKDQHAIEKASSDSCHATLLQKEINTLRCAGVIQDSTYLPQYSRKEQRQLPKR
jgi:hypothetical protein